jgi:hypothetical protein
MKVFQFFKVLFFLLLIGIIYTIWQTRHLSDKFEKTKLDISYNQLIDNWGKPDKEFDMSLSYDQRHILVYSDYFGYKYIFASQKGKTIISEKYLDD